MTIPVTYIPEFLREEVATAFFKDLWSELEWIQLSDAPRREYWTNTLQRPYTYGRGEGRRTYEHQPTHPDIEYVAKRLWVEHQLSFEGCFLNGYRDERDSLGWHADDDPGIDHSKPIAVVTLYDGPVMPANYEDLGVLQHRKEPKSRILQVRPIDGDKSSITDIAVEHGSLLLMHPGMQSTHLHKIPKAGYKSRPRISLTFRGLK